MHSKTGKIIVVTITRIESDIIESFVRYTLTYADEIIVFDNGSMDGTQEILQELRAEGLPLQVIREEGNVEFNHGEQMTKLCFMAQKRHADIIVPIDVDEFLINTENTISVRDLLLTINSEELVVVPLVQYQLSTEYNGESYLLWQECSRISLKEESNITPKCMMGREVPRKGFALAQGCHYASQNDNAIPSRRVRFLHLAHFHYRSDMRYQLKTMLGWLGTVCKYGLYTPVCEYMKSNYRHIMNSDNKYIYQDSREVDEKVDLRKFCSLQKIKYQNLVNFDILKLIMAESQQLAEAYAEEKVKYLGKRVDVLVPFWGDNEALVSSLGQLDEQNYPNYKVWVLCLQADRPAIVDSDDVACICMSFSTSDEKELVWQRLDGDYVFWLMPCITIPQRHILQLVTTVEKNGYDWRLVIIQPNAFVTDNEEYVYMPSKSFWHVFANQDDWDREAGLRNTIISQKLMQEATSYFDEALTDEGIDYKKIWQGLLNTEINLNNDDVCIFFSHEEISDRKAYRCIAQENRRAVILSKLYP